MAAKKTAEKTAKKSSSTSAKAPLAELIVRRGALRRFHELQKKTAELPVKLTWDRRLSERRRASKDVERDTRVKDRRGTPPFTWETADFVVVETPAPKPQTARKRHRPKLKVS
jgi:hypothetical protein